MALDSAGMRLHSSTNQTFVEFHGCSFFSLNNIYIKTLEETCSTYYYVQITSRKDGNSPSQFLFRKPFYAISLNQKIINCSLSLDKTLCMMYSFDRLLTAYTEENEGTLYLKT